MARDQASDDEPRALDGKVVCGSYDLEVDGTMRDEVPKQQPSAVGIPSGLVIDRQGLTRAKEDAEGTILSAAFEAWLHTECCVITNALYTTHGTARHMLDHGLHYLLTVKGNQPTIQEQLRDDCHWTAVTQADSGLGHGRIERRTIQVSPELDRECPWLAFPEVRFAPRRVREVICKKTGAVRATQVVYLLTSLLPELNTTEHLYRTIENRVHEVRDTALKEYACRVRKGSLPRVMAAFTNLAIPVLRLLGNQNVKHAMSNFKMRPNTAVGVVWTAAACGGGP